VTDAVVFNTCAVTGEAVRQARQAIRKARRENPGARLIVTGCAAQIEPETFAAMPEVDLVLGNADKARPGALSAGADGPRVRVNDIMSVRETAGHLIDGLKDRARAYVEVQNGCDHRCTFCIIPSMRGDLVSRPIGDVLKEAQALFEGGVKELLVISQDTSAYGVDVKYRTGFWEGRPVKTRMLELVQALGEMAQKHGAWVRLHYVYPYPSVDDIVPLMATGLVLPYLDVPLQHSHPDVLKRMKRPASGEKNLERIQKWREMCPQLVIRSTFIAGFPGETEAEFEHLLNFVQEAQIDRAGCFAYSPVQGATANNLPGMLPQTLREERQARFMAVAEAVSTQKLKSRIGSTMQVLVDSAKSMGKQGGVGRTYADAPEIDGVVHLLPPEKVSKTYKTGEFTKVRIVDAQGHDLIGLPV
jgi:ribosomal protein S12 methylthiotransferase